MGWIHGGGGGARGVKYSCIATKYVRVCCNCKKRPRTGGGIEPKRIVGDLYSFPLIFHLREHLGERLKEFCGVQGQFKVSFLALWLAQFHDGATRD